MQIKIIITKKKKKKLWATWVGNHPQEDEVKFGYKSKFGYKVTEESRKV
jgi:hypothetical protein